MKIVFDANEVSVTGDTNTPVICSDVMRACGYVPTGVAREFNVFPSYRLVRIPTKKRRVAVVDMAHAVEWLRYKNRRCRLPDNRKCKQVVAEFAQVWLNGLAKDSNGLENSMIYRLLEPPTSIDDPGADVQESAESDEHFASILVELSDAKQQLCQFNAEIAEITERKAQFVKRLELLKNKLMELESLV